MVSWRCMTYILLSNNTNYYGSIYRISYKYQSSSILIHQKFKNTIRKSSLSDDYFTKWWKSSWGSADCIRKSYILVSQSISHYNVSPSNNSMHSDILRVLSPAGLLRSHWAHLRLISLVAAYQYWPADAIEDNYGDMLLHIGYFHVSLRASRRYTRFTALMTHTPSPEELIASIFIIFIFIILLLRRFDSRTIGFSFIIIIFQKKDNCDRQMKHIILKLFHALSLHYSVIISLFY